MLLAWFGNLLSRRARRVSSRRFLCPHCLRFSKYRLACGACWLKVKEELVHANTPCPRCQKPLQENVLACCKRCMCGCDNAAYHQRPVSVLAALRPSDFASICRAYGASRTLAQGTLGCVFDNGTWLAYVLNLRDLSDAKSFVRSDAFREMVIWVDAAGDDDMKALSLSFVEEADRFTKQAGLREAQRRAVMVYVRQDSLEPAVGHALATRFGTIKYGVAFPLLDGVQAKVRALGEIRYNFTMCARLLELKSRFFGAPHYVARKLKREISDGSAVPVLVAALKNRDYAGARVAAALEEIGRPAVPALIDALTQSRKDTHRYSAAELLGKIGDKPAVRALCDALKDRNEGVRGNAAKSLGQIGDKSAVAGLNDALKDSGNWVRKYAAEALGKIGDQAAVPALVDALEDSEDYVRYTATGALVSIGKLAVPALTRAFNQGNWNYNVNLLFNLSIALIKIGDPAVPAFCDALNDSNSSWFSRERAVNGLLKIGTATAIDGLVKAGEASVPELIGELNDYDEDVRCRAAEVLVSIGNPAVPALIDALKDSKERVRSNAADLLGRIGYKATAPALIDALRDTSEWVRTSAAMALAKIGDKTDAAVPVLINRLKDCSSWGREGALEALVQIGEPAIPWLISAFKDKNNVWWLSVEAEKALVQIGGPAVPLLIEVLKGSDEKLYRRAAEALEKIGDKTAVPALIELMNHSTARDYVLSALGTLGDKAAVPAVINALNARESYVRRNAVGALGKIGDESAVPALTAALKDSNEEVRSSAALALSKLGDRTEATVTVLVDSLKHSNGYVCRNVAEALGQIGNKAVVPALEAADHEHHGRDYSLRDGDCSFCEALRRLKAK